MSTSKKPTGSYIPRKVAKEIADALFKKRVGANLSSIIERDSFSWGVVQLVRNGPTGQGKEIYFLSIDISGAVPFEFVVTKAVVGRAISKGCSALYKALVATPKALRLIAQYDDEIGARVEALEISLAAKIRKTNAIGLTAVPAKRQVKRLAPRR